MEWSSNKKVKRYLVVYLIYFVLFSLFMFMAARYTIAGGQRKMIALMTEYPELEAGIIDVWERQELRLTGEKGVQEEGFPDKKESARIIQMLEDKYGYDMSDMKSAGGLWIFWGAGIAAGTAWIVTAGYLDWKKVSAERCRLQELYECLVEFREGGFGAIPDYETYSKEYLEEWMKVWESLRELGGYFEGLKKRLKVDEKNTKTLITDISHQLKTSLASLRMCHELVAEAGLTSEEKSEFVRQEGREIEKLETLLCELVNLSRLEAHLIQISPVPASLKKTIAGAVGQVYMKARNKDIEIQAEIEEDLTVSHDVKWTEEAMVNILDNAVKYSREDTVVTVRMKPLVRNVLVEIEDQGIGIRKEELTKIYQRFYRGSDAAKIEKDGVGVGLYLARMILERQGGTISAKQKKGGTIFRITLPC